MFWCFDVWVFRCLGVWVFGCSGVWVFGCSGVQVFRCSGVQVFRCSGVQVFRCSAILAQAISVQKLCCLCTQRAISLLVSLLHTSVAHAQRKVFFRSVHFAFIGTVRETREAPSMGHRGWQHVHVLTGWVQIIRGPRPKSEKWPLASSKVQETPSPGERWRRAAITWSATRCKSFELTAAKVRVGRLEAALAVLAESDSAEAHALRQVL